MRKTSTTLLTDKLLGLEALRFVAAFAVLVWHYQHFAFIADKPADLARTQLPFYNLLYPFYEAGEYGVWVFWCISGFIFFWKYRDTISDRTIGGWTFLVFRLSRLYPLHFATLLVVALLQPMYFHQQGFFFVYQNNDIQHFLPQLLLASDWGLERSNSFNGPIWSISVEVLVYAVFFLMLRFVTKSPLLNVIVIVICVTVNAQVCSCLAFFYAGGLAAIGRRAIARSRFRIWLESLAWCAVITVPTSIWSFDLQPAIISWIFALIYTPILLLCLSGEIALSAPAQRLLVIAGNMTYSSYLLHFPVQLGIAELFAVTRRPIPLYDDLFCGAFMLAILLASYLTYRYFEAPAQTLIRGFLLSKSIGRSDGCSPAHGQPWPPIEP